MDTQITPRNGSTAGEIASLSANFQMVLSTGVRLSSAASMYSLQQFETALGIIQSGKGFSDQIACVQTTVDDVTKVLTDEVSQGKKEAIESIGNVGGQLIRQSWEGLAMFDPREILRTANKLALKSSETISHWVSRKSSVPAEEPKLAADVLAG